MDTQRPNKFPFQAFLVAALTAAFVCHVTHNARAFDIVYDNSSTSLGSGSAPIFDAGQTTVRTEYQEFGDIVTLDPGTTSDRQLANIRIGYFVQDIPNDGMNDDRFIADVTFRVYPVNEAGDVVDAVLFERVVSDFVWFDGSFAQTFNYPQEEGGTVVLPETFAWTLSVSERIDDPDTAGDGIATAFSFNTRGPVTIGSSPDGLLRRNNGVFETITFGSGRQARITIFADTVTIDALRPGDFNGDGVVDAADYTVWRDNELNVDESALSVGSGDGGDVGPGDYSLWSTYFGAIGVVDTGLSVATPEPTTIGLAVIAGLMCCPATRRRVDG